VASISMIFPFFLRYIKRSIGNEKAKKIVTKIKAVLFSLVFSIVNAKRINNKRVKDGGTNRVEIILAANRLLSFFSISYTAYP
jgi:hypothetical protein